ncbi:unnamed protein product [Protopolystoma xenopodis]|uniref:Uncharacterized protein n=1 Tax=Protopolystoma xenopodis TaxID=117903 RepID=A0A448WZV6_9PLAT|nr:unnamed protein product [Protopolystoma xenopodis]
MNLWLFTSGFVNNGGLRGVATVDPCKRMIAFHKNINLDDFRILVYKEFNIHPCLIACIKNSQGIIVPFSSKSITDTTEDAPYTLEGLVQYLANLDLRFSKAEREICALELRGFSTFSVISGLSAPSEDYGHECSAADMGFSSSNQEIHEGLINQTSIRSRKIMLKDEPLWCNQDTDIDPPDQAHTDAQFGQLLYELEEMQQRLDRMIEANWTGILNHSPLW